MTINFNKEHFKQISFNYIFVNQTSGIEFRNYKQVCVNEFHEKGVTFTAPKNTCAKGHNLLLIVLPGARPKVPKKIPIDGNVKGSVFETIGKVHEKTEHYTNPDLSIINLQFSQLDVYAWEEFLKKFKDKQEDITNLLKDIATNER